MKNPNGYGTVTKLSGNRRKPWVVKEGKSGKQKPIGYTTTREEGLIMLAKYNNDPWDIETDKITLQELYDLWLEKRAVKLGSSNQSSLKSAYKHCSKLGKVRYNQIKSSTGNFGLTLWTSCKWNTPRTNAATPSVHGWIRRVQTRCVLIGSWVTNRREQVKGSTLIKI